METYYLKSRSLWACLVFFREASNFGGFRNSVVVRWVAYAVKGFNACRCEGPSVLLDPGVYPPRDVESPGLLILASLWTRGAYGQGGPRVP